MQSGPIAITEKLLSSAGGWEAMKAARELVKAGRVVSANYDPPLLAGEVHEDAKRYRAGLRIRSAADVENLCSCREAREWGKICPHSLAVGLALLAPPPTVVPSPVWSERPGEKTTTRFVSLGESAERLVRLQFILPPNFANALARGQIMVCLEAELENRRMPFDALPGEERFALDDFDLAALESLGTEAGSVNQLSTKAFLCWLPALRGHPRLSFGKSTRVEVMPEAFRPLVSIRPVGDRFELTVRTGSQDQALIAGAAIWFLRGNQFWEVGENLPSRLTNLFGAPLLLTRAQLDEFFALELPMWREFVEVELPAGVSIPAIELAQPAFVLRLEGSLQHLRAKLSCTYGNRPAFAPLAQPEERFVLRENDRLLIRNLAAEKEAVARLERAGFSRTAGNFELRDPDRTVRFFAFELANMPNDWEVKVEPRLEKSSAEIEPVRANLEIVRSGEDWFELKYSVASAAGEGIPLAEIQRLLRSGVSHSRLTNGKTAVLDPEALDDFEQLLRDVEPRQSQPGIYRLNKIQAGYLANTATEIGARLVDAANALRQTRLTEIAPLPGPLNAQLREYQRAGVKWLAALDGQDLGESWRTRWAWAKPCKCSRSSSPGAARSPH